MITGDLFKFIHLGTQPQQHLVVATETEACMVSKRAVPILLECFFVHLPFTSLEMSNYFIVALVPVVNRYLKISMSEEFHFSDS